ncbi:hypothetical protein M409DRAFT_16939 [Zasmidium cellare ATCC 36951]|uniref:F-box domain-containing protein n=1 Tax=Zasmidium cellare ATCC 36951 TaxID=1080233 RepID=A0A6A6D4D6_ZASCE|nr:uncharacterized protein M409DRAFT_16939 [Zasmidium cellare ATCC 36951]KAF2172989.1 hypothetical protein M409DRAFT_16939 [Zasmidium cellare ATCC 36951]
MATRLDALPKELLSHIAVNSDALSILRLSQTCRTIRSACYDSLVFRELLSNQSNLWAIHSLDVEALENRSWELAQKESPLETPANFVNWLPELFVVKHPFMYQQCWGRFLWDPPQLTAKQMFCFAMAIIAQPHEPMQQLEKSLAMHEDAYLRRDESSKAYFWGLCFMILRVRKVLHTRPAARPYHTAAVPYMTLPTATDIDMRPTNSSYQLPLPFGDPSSPISNWDNWYVTHSREMAKEYLFEGTWSGYYTYFRSFVPSLERFDPPMVQIRFVRRQASHGEPTEALEVAADDGVDGIGSFVVRGSVSQVDDVFTFRGHKAYGDGAGIMWNWKLKLTPLGMIGYWGRVQDNDELYRNGSVWLWKAPS